MKHNILFTVLVFSLFIASSTYAQLPGVGKVTKKLPKVNLGLKAGANFETLSGNSWQNTYKPGIVFGGFVRVYKGNWGLDVEALLNTASYSPTDSLVKGTFRALYVDVPVLLEYKLFHRLWLQAGPQFSPLISMSNSAVQDAQKSFKSGYFSGVVGLQVILPVHFVIGARYILGLSDINNVNAGSATGAWKNRSAQLYVGFRFL